MYIYIYIIIITTIKKTHTCIFFEQPFFHTNLFLSMLLITATHHPLLQTPAAHGTVDTAFGDAANAGNM